MRVVQINPFIDAAGRLPLPLLQDWWTLRHCAEGAAQAGVHVDVLQASTRRAHAVVHGVGYHCLPMHGVEGGLDRLFAALVARLQPDVIHLHGMGFHREVHWLSALSPGRPLVLQDHAAQPPSRPWAWWRWRRALACARGLMFCARAQAQPFVQRHLVAAHTRIHEVPEASSDFQPLDRGLARRLTGVAGAPAVLWVGHLNANKDPLTVLEGVARAAVELPGLQLWMCFGEAPLVEAVRERLHDPRLAGRVHLLGRVPHAQVAWLMGAADLLVQGSHREGSGYSVIEALASGLSPVVTDIASFRSLVGDLPEAQSAALWPVGDAAALAAALVRLGVSSQARRDRVRRRFEAHCSLPALGRSLLASYVDALAP